MFSFEGQVAWVTGSSTGIGRATALAFAQRGEDVVVHCHNSLVMPIISLGKSLK